MLSNQVPITELREEVAYHEASHFVISQLIIKEFPIFHSPDFVIVDVNKGKQIEARIYGFVPDVFEKENTLGNAEKMQKILGFYDRNNQGVYLYCLQLMAGYNSYKIFIENRENHFGLIEKNDFIEVKEKNTVRYYSLKEAPTDSRFWFVKDIDDCHNKLKYIGFTDKDSKDKYLVDVISDLDKLMTDENIQKAIEFTKDQLLASNGKKMEGENLNQLTDKVVEIINQTFISDFVDEDKLKNKNVA